MCVNSDSRLSGRGNGGGARGQKEGVQQIRNWTGRGVRKDKKRVIMTKGIQQWVGEVIMVRVEKGWLKKGNNDKRGFPMGGWRSNKVVGEICK